MKREEKRKQKEEQKERERRARVVKGWAFWGLSDKQVAAIRAYLNGGPVPKGYEDLDKIVK